MTCSPPPCGEGGGGGGGGGVGANERQYSFDRRVRVVDGLRIGNPDHPVPTRLEPGLAFGVAGSHVIQVVNRAIHFDDQPMMMADKVHDVGSERRLATAVRPRDLDLSQRL